MYSCDNYHKNFVNKAQIVAKELKQRMVEHVRRDPAAPVGEAIRSVKLEAAAEYGENEDVFNEFVDALGSFQQNY